ncbi:MAG: RNA methyltransferase [Paludibacteraceae bacterium]|nr:RNA methyltransferase [Paludibacteraceae bacterium]
MSRKLETEEIIRISTEEFKQAKKIPLVMVLDNVRSMHNIGSVFRTSDAYLIEKVVLCGITAQPPHPEIHKSALGAEFSVDWEYYADTNEAVEALKNQGYEVWAIEQAENSVMLQDFFKQSECSPKLGVLSKGLKGMSNSQLSTKYAVVMGNEVKGVQQSVIDRCEGCIELPQFGTKHSLNVSVTAGIVIWEFFKSLHDRMT